MGPTCYLAISIVILINWAMGWKRGRSTRDGTGRSRSIRAQEGRPTRVKCTKGELWVEGFHQGKEIAWWRDGVGIVGIKNKLKVCCSELVRGKLFREEVRRSLHIFGSVPPAITLCGHHCRAWWGADNGLVSAIDPGPRGRERAFYVFLFFKTFRVQIQILLDQTSLKTLLNISNFENDIWFFVIKTSN